MSWLHRGEKSYYYRPKKVQGRVIVTFCGTGERAEKAGEEDAQRRARRESEQQRLRDFRQRWTEILNAARPLDDLTTLLVRAALFAADYHEHQRTWRRRRSAQHRLQLSS
jgi:hypothetical protein